MKRIVMFLLSILLVGALSAQDKNNYQYVYNLFGGLRIGGTWSTKVPNTGKITDMTLDGNYLKVYEGATQRSFGIAPTDQVQAGTIQPLNADTIPLFVVGGGVGLNGSQSSFLPNAYLGSFSNSSNKDTINITSARFFVLQDSGTVTMGFRFYKHATTLPTSASTDLMSNVITLSAATNATTTGTIITLSSTPHFDVYTLLPGETVAAIVTVKSNGNMPKYMNGTVFGYKQNRTY